MGRGGGAKKDRGGWRWERWMAVAVAVVSYVLLVQGLLSRSWRRGGRPRVNTDPSVCNSDALVAWAKKKGVVADNVAVADFLWEDSHDAAFAVFDALSCMGQVSAEHIKNNTQHPVSVFAREEEKALSQVEIMALFLLHEYHNPEGDWAPYVCLLPREKMSTMFWKEDDLRALNNIALYNRTINLLRTLEWRHRAHVMPAVKRHPGVFDIRDVSVENWLWAMGNVNARNWGVTVPGRGKMNVMSPIADLFNHRQYDRGGPWLYPGGSDGLGGGGSEAEFRLYSGHDYDRGDEVFISYGTDCNDRFLLNYGFKLPGNDAPCRNQSATRKTVTKDPLSLKGPLILEGQRGHL